MNPFIFLFETTQNKYVYDVNSNEIIQVNPLTFDILHLLKVGLKESEIFKILKDNYDSDEITQVINGLKENNRNNIYFSSNRPDKISMFCCKEGADYYYNNHISQLTLEVTQRCNLKCRYCYFSDMYKLSRSRSDIDMPWEIAKAGLDMMLERGGPSPAPLTFEPFSHLARCDFCIGFYGGEPLLNVSLIKKCIEYIKKNGSTKKSVGKKSEF